MSDSNSETAEKRLKTMCDTYDGYKIAESDLALRGPGDFLKNTVSTSFRQSGGLKFRIADMCEDSELMKSAFSAAKKLLESSHRAYGKDNGADGIIDVDSRSGGARCGLAECDFSFCGCRSYLYPDFYCYGITGGGNRCANFGGINKRYTMRTIQT